MNRWSDAEDACRRFYAMRPEFSDAPTYLTLSLIPQGRFAEAKDAAEAAIRNEPRQRLGRLLWDRIVAWESDESALRAALEPGPISPMLKLELELRDERARLQAAAAAAR